MTVDLPMTGGCACGAIRYECTAEPLMFLLCRCEACRHMTGSAFAANAWFPTDTVTFTKGSPKEFVRTAASGQPVRHRFCPDCGSPVGLRADAYAEIAGVPAGSLDDASALQPAANVWVGSKLPWDRPDDGLPAYEHNIQL